jgi:protease IV
MSFFKSFFASLLAIIVFSVLMLILLFGIVGALTSQEKVVVTDNSVLHLKLDGPITEMQVDNPFDGLPLPGAGESGIGLLQLKSAIAHAKSDDNIKGIYLECSYAQTGFSSIEEIRQSLIDFRKSGKWVIAYSETMSEGAYYLATAADNVYLYPEGEMELNGLTLEISFFKRLFDKLEIKPEIFRVGEFKSAVEPFMLEKMSAENRLQLTELAHSINGFMIQQIAEGRKLPVEKVKEISDNMLVRKAADAKELGLVDDLLYEDQVQEQLKKKLGIDNDKDVSFIKYKKYRKSYSDYVKSDNEIAVIVADGNIMPGENQGQDQVIGGETFVQEIRKARNNKRIKAIVMRINSPGGEFRASDMMWREIQLAKEQKPVIASMSDYAASGGYYMAMGCDTIVAQPNTITGSIGIFGMRFDMSSFLGNKIGITFDEVRTGNFGEMYSVSRPLTEPERAILQKSLEEYYDTFTRKAAEGRHMPQPELLKIASGRVWTGSQAGERKLVDIQGGFNDAVRIAAEKAGVGTDYKVRYYPEQKSFLEEWVQNMESETEAEAMRNQLGEYYLYFEQIKKIKSYQGSQARMPFEFQIQ